MLYIHPLSSLGIAQNYVNNLKAILINEFIFTCFIYKTGKSKNYIIKNYICRIWKKFLHLPGISSV